MSILSWQEYYDDVSEVTAGVKNGRLSGLMYFSSNFSQGLQNRMENFAGVDDADIIAGQIQVSLDMGGM